MSKYRDKCLQRKGEMCAICDSEEDVEVHHLDGDRFNNDIDNLEPLCQDCHNAVHRDDEGYEEYTDKIQPNEKYELTKRQEAVLDVFREEERANPYRVREQTPVSKYSINQILNWLCEEGYVRKVTRGLYELDDAN